MNVLILKLLAQRVVLALLSLLAVSAVVFAITAVLPGDAAQEQLGQDVTPEALAALRAQMGLDVPAPQRYLRWLGGMLRGDLGTSSTTQLFPALASAATEARIPSIKRCSSRPISISTEGNPSCSNCRNTIPLASPHIRGAIMSRKASPDT